MDDGEREPESGPSHEERGKEPEPLPAEPEGEVPEPLQAEPEGEEPEPASIGPERDTDSVDVPPASEPTVMAEGEGDELSPVPAEQEDVSCERDNYGCEKGP